MRDVETYAAVRADIMASSDNLGAYFTAFSALNVIPKLWDGRWRIEGLGGEALALVDVQRTCMPLPIGDPATYFKTVIAAVEKYGNAHCVPRWVTDNFAGPYNVAEIDTEYLIPTNVLRGAAGQAHRSIRNNIHHAQTRLALDTTSSLTRLLALNDRWYQQAKSHHHRLHDKADIRAILTRWNSIKDMVPDIRLAAVCNTETEEAEAFSIGSALSSLHWHGYTVRYDRDGVRGGADLAQYHLAGHFNQLCENSGGADNSTLREWKRKQSKMSLQVFAIRPKRK